MLMETDTDGMECGAEASGRKINPSPGEKEDDEDEPRYHEWGKCL